VIGHPQGDKEGLSTLYGNETRKEDEGYLSGGGKRSFGVTERKSRVRGKRGTCNHQEALDVLFEEEGPRL